MVRTRKPSQVKDSGAKIVTVRAVVSFDDWVIGNERQVPLTERMLSLIAGGQLEVIDHGESETGPGPAGPSDPGGSPADDQGEGAPGPEQGQGFGSSGYGTAES